MIRICDDSGLTMNRIKVESDEPITVGMFLEASFYADGETKRAGRLHVVGVECTEGHNRFVLALDVAATLAVPSIAPLDYLFVAGARADLFSLGNIVHYQGSPPHWGAPIAGDLEGPYPSAPIQVYGDVTTEQVNALMKAHPGRRINFNGAVSLEKGTIGESDELVGLRSEAAHLRKCLDTSNAIRDTLDSRLTSETHRANALADRCGQLQHERDEATRRAEQAESRAYRAERKVER